MPFQNSTGFQNQNTAGGDKKKVNFPLGRVYGSDGHIRASIWISDSAVYTILTPYRKIGNDPSTGRDAYEQAKPADLPRVFLNPETLRVFLEAAKILNKNTGSFNVPQKRGSEFKVTANNGQIKLLFKSDKGEREITLEATPVGDSTVNGSWANLISMAELGFKKALTAKLDPDEFGMVVGGDNSEEEVPI